MGVAVGLVNGSVNVGSVVVRLAFASALALAVTDAPLGAAVGDTVGWAVGAAVGCDVGPAVGAAVGCLVGGLVGAGKVSVSPRAAVLAPDGTLVGCCVGTWRHVNTTRLSIVHTPKKAGVTLPHHVQQVCIKSSRHQPQDSGAKEVCSPPWVLPKVLLLAPLAPLSAVWLAQLSAAPWAGRSATSWAGPLAQVWAAPSVYSRRPGVKVFNCMVP